MGIFLTEWVYYIRSINFPCLIIGWRGGGGGAEKFDYFSRDFLKYAAEYGVGGGGVVK